MEGGGGGEEEEEEEVLSREKRKRGKEKEEEEEEGEMREESKRLKAVISNLEYFIKNENNDLILLLMYNLPYRSIKSFCFTSTTIRNYCLKKLDEHFWRAMWLSDMNHFVDFTMTDKKTGTTEKLLSIIDSVASHLYTLKSSSIWYDFMTPKEQEIANFIPLSDQDEDSKILATFSLFQTDIKNPTRVQIFYKFESVLSHTYFMWKLMRYFPSRMPAAASSSSPRNPMGILMVSDGYDGFLDSKAQRLFSGRKELSFNWWDTLKEDDYIFVNNLGGGIPTNKDWTPTFVNSVDLHTTILSTNITGFRRFSSSYPAQFLISFIDTENENIWKRIKNEARDEQGHYFDVGAYNINSRLHWRKTIEKLEVGEEEDRSISLSRVAKNEKLILKLGTRPAPFSEGLVVSHEGDELFNLSLEGGKDKVEQDVLDLVINYRILILAFPEKKLEVVGGYASPTMGLLGVHKRDLIVLYDSKGKSLDGRNSRQDFEPILGIYGYEDGDIGVLQWDYSARFGGDEVVIELGLLANYRRREEGTYDLKILQGVPRTLFFSALDMRKFLFTPELESNYVINPEVRRSKHAEILSQSEIVGNAKSVFATDRHHHSYPSPFLISPWQSLYKPDTSRAAPENQREENPKLLLMPGGRGGGSLERPRVEKLPTTVKSNLLSQFKHQSPLIVSIGEQSFFLDLTTFQPVCNHVFQREEVKKRILGIQQHKKYEILSCSRCENLPQPPTSSVKFLSKRRLNSRHNSRTSSWNHKSNSNSYYIIDNNDKEEEEEEEEEMMEEEDPTSKVDFLLWQFMKTNEASRMIIWNYYHPQNNPMPEYLIESEITFFGGERQSGIFTTQTIPKDFKIGVYSGLVLGYHQSEQPITIPTRDEYQVVLPILAGPTIVFDIVVDASLLPGTFPTDSIISSVNWTGKINHKWGWKFVAGIPPSWVDLFANLDLNEIGTIYSREIGSIEASPGDLVELFWDYGIPYWAGKPIKPLWDLRKAPDDFINFLTKGTVPPALASLDAKRNRLLITEPLIESIPESASYLRIELQHLLQKSTLGMTQDQYQKVGIQKFQNLGINPETDIVIL